MDIRDLVWCSKFLPFDQNDFPNFLSQNCNTFLDSQRPMNDLGSKVRNAFGRAPKITLLSTKTVSEYTSTSTPATQDPQTFVRGSSLAISFESSAPSSCATARDQCTNKNKSRFFSLPPLLPIAEKEDSVKIPVSAPVWGRDGELPILFSKLPTSPVFPTSPVWSPSQHEEVVVMQQSQREAWKYLGRRFKAAHDEDATSPHHASARAAVGRRSSMSHPCTSGAPPPPAQGTPTQSRAQDRRASLPDPRVPVLARTLAFRPGLKAAAVVRGSPLGAASTRLGPRHVFSRQVRRLT